MQQSQEKISIWLDCDPGLDDTLAIIYAAYSPRIHLVGISTSPGNTTLKNTTQNALDILYNIGRSDLEVFAGADAQLQGELTTASIVHGENGLGGVNIPQSPKKAITNNSFAQISALIMKQEQPITWVNTGSLTNLCLLLMTFPNIKQKLKQIVMMGGAIERGNITPAAEFNIYCDPSAFERVLVLKGDIPLVMIPLETTHLFLVSQETLESFQKHIEHPFGQALYTMILEYQKFYVNVNGWPFPPYHDPVTIYYLLYPQDFERRAARIQVDTYQRSKGRTNCYFCQEGEPQGTTFVTTGMAQPLDKFWKEMLEALNNIFTEAVQAKIQA